MKRRVEKKRIKRLLRQEHLHWKRGRDEATHREEFKPRSAVGWHREMWSAVPHVSPRQREYFSILHTQKKVDWPDPSAIVGLGKRNEMMRVLYDRRGARLNLRARLNAISEYDAYMCALTYAEAKLGWRNGMPHLWEAKLKLLIVTPRTPVHRDTPGWLPCVDAQGTVYRLLLDHQFEVSVVPGAGSAALSNMNSTANTTAAALIRNTGVIRSALKVEKLHE